MFVYVQAIPGRLNELIRMRPTFSWEGHGIRGRAHLTDATYVLEAYRYADAAGPGGADPSPSENDLRFILYWPVSPAPLHYSIVHQPLSPPRGLDELIMRIIFFLRTRTG